MNRDTKIMLAFCAFIAAQLISCMLYAEDTAPKRQPSRTYQMLAAMPRAKRDLDEPDVARAARLERIADAINRATKERWQRNLLLSVGYEESKWARGVEDCSVKGDSGKAVGFWQSWNMTCEQNVDEWAMEAIRHLRSAWLYCRAKTNESRVRRGVSLYGTGRTCFHPVADSRVALWRRLEAL